MRFVSLLLISFLISACGPIAVSYTPQSIYQGSGYISVGYFEYVPHMNGTLAANQIENTAIGDVKINQNISDYFKGALQSELKYAGFTLNKGTRTIEGIVDRFLCDDLGYSVDWTVNVSYVFKENDEVVGRKNVVTHTDTHKFSDIVTLINLAAGENIDALFISKEFNEFIKKE